MKPFRLMVVMLLLGGALVLPACRSSGVLSPDPRIDDEGYRQIMAMPDDSTKERLLGEFILNSIGGPICTGSGQCRTMEFGSKACGGPQSYLVYSTATTDSAALLILVKQFNALQDEMNRKYRRISDCGLPPRPRVGCVDGRCAEVSD